MVDQLEVVEIVVDPLMAGTGVEFVKVGVVGADEVDVLVAIGLSVGVERAAGCGDRAVSREEVEIVVDPLSVGVDVEFVHVAVGADEVDVLGVVGAPVAAERAAWRGRGAVAGEEVQIVVDPLMARSDVELVKVAIVPMKLTCWPLSGPRYPQSVLSDEGAIPLPEIWMRSLLTQWPCGVM